MKGYVNKFGELAPHSDDGKLSDWENKVVDAIGNLIEFWGFKRNQGRLWALLYLRNHPMPAGDLQEQLGLSKGSVSTITRDLERWGVLHRVRVTGENSWHFRAETDLVQMVCHVMEEREAKIIHQVKLDLEDAIYVAECSGEASEAELERLRQMKLLATISETLLSLVLQASRFSMDGLQGVLQRIQKWVSRSIN